MGDDDEHSSKRRQAESLVADTLAGHEEAVDERVTGINVAGKVKGLVRKGGAEPAPPVEKGPLS